jgi:hypothetical protein
MRGAVRGERGSWRIELKANNGALSAPFGYWYNSADNIYCMWNYTDNPKMSAGNNLMFHFAT